MADCLNAVFLSPKDQSESVALRGEKPAHFTNGRISIKTDDEGDSLTETDEEFFSADGEGLCNTIII